MYTPSAFEESRPEVLRALIEQHRLGAIVTHGPEGLAANHVPFVLAPPCDGGPHGVLQAHVARANALWRCGGEAMVLFQGASAYVSPSLYEEKPLTGKVVPTWNYAVVHAHGTLRAIENPAWLMALLARMTDTFEGERDLPWAMHDAPRDFLDKLMDAIVGIEIPIARIQGKWKMSQNRSAGDQRRVAADTGLPMQVRA